ncbi:hypothetical protein niasHT_027882 [Heterodera trifolii]|uniref:B30.2/SPRY domain-containing protein n=1 Tax=Heterodera trifolii TaxID=157864 RepID=A0ABD2KJW7_9BILA
MNAEKDMDKATEAKVIALEEHQKKEEAFIGVLKDRFGKEHLKAVPPDIRKKIAELQKYQSDGHFWANGSKNFGMPNFSHGDFVGCGINLATQRIIFTKNGQPLDTSDLFLSPPFDFALFPFVSLNNSGDLIETNFGPQFKFDPLK